MKPLYMEVTRDRYELPLAVADSPWELARMRGVTVYPHPARGLSHEPDAQNEICEGVGR